MYRASVENRGDATFHATTTRSGFTMGADGPNPVDVFLASVCPCIGHYAGDHLRRREIPFTRFTVAAEAEKAVDTGRLGFVNVRIEVQGWSPDPRQSEELLREADRCLLHNTVKAACPVEITVARAR